MREECNANHRVRLAFHDRSVRVYAQALAAAVLISGCSSTVRGIDVEGENCERLKVIYDSDKKKMESPGG